MDSNRISCVHGIRTFTYDPDRISQDGIKEVINKGHFRAKDIMTESTPSEREGTGHYDLIIIGGDSAAFSAAIKSESLGLTTPMINGRMEFGDTCVNVSCVPAIQ